MLCFFWLVTDIDKLQNAAQVLIKKWRSCHQPSSLFHNEHRAVGHVMIDIQQFVGQKSMARNGILARARHQTFHKFLWLLQLTDPLVNSIMPDPLYLLDSKLAENILTRNKGEQNAYFNHVELITQLIIYVASNQVVNDHMTQFHKKCRSIDNIICPILLMANACQSW